MDVRYCCLNNVFSNVVVAQIHSDSGNMVKWNLFLMFFIIVVIISAFLLYHFSHKPEEWKHQSILEKHYTPGVLTRLSENIRLMDAFESNKSYVKCLIRSIFFEKVGLKKVLSDVEIDELERVAEKEKDRGKLMGIIRDEDIVDWILDEKNVKLETRYREEGKKMKKRERIFFDLAFILDKMQRWGE
jgi:hypothetical protein